MLPHLTRQPATEYDWIRALIDLARYLRGPEGCPWDREQTTQTFANFALEETQEYIDAIATGVPKDIEEEFGDALFVLLASAAAAEEERLFDLRSALERAHTKMVRRHDHVFGERRADTPEQAIEAWNDIKNREKHGDSTP